MNMQALIQKLRYMVLVRLLIVAFFLTVGAFLFHMDPLVYYGAFSVFLGLSLVYVVWLFAERALEILAYLQIICDILTISVFVHYTGGIDSVLAMMYALPILGSGLFLFPRAPLFVALLSSAFFALTVILDYVNAWPKFLPKVPDSFMSDRNGIYILYMTYVRTSILVVLGFMASYLFRLMDRMERAIKENERFSLLGEMAAQLAHEIKNPLVAISGSVEVLDEELKGKLSKENEKLMDAIVSESQRLKLLFEKVLDYSRYDELERQKVSLKEILDELALLIQPSLKNGRTIRFSPVYQQKPDLIVNADKDRLKQVFINVLNNAIEAMPQGGELEIQSAESRFDTKVMISDTGIGMNARQRQELFLPFKSQKKGGTGIGLAIAHKIVRNHGGRITVKSKPGKGTRFIISIPKVA